MKICCITDLHNDRGSLSRILATAGEIELVLLGGDITAFGSAQEAEAIVRQIQEAGVPVLAVAGNCDSRMIEQRLADLGVSVFRRGVVREGIGFFGVSAMPPWTGRMYELTEGEISDALELGWRETSGAARRVVLAHPPPFESLDRTNRNERAGSRALRKFIDDRQPDLVVCGHIHEGRGVDEIGLTKVVNCGAAMWGFYAWVEIGMEGPIRIELCRA